MGTFLAFAQLGFSHYSRKEKKLSLLHDLITFKASEGREKTHRKWSQYGSRFGSSLCPHIALEFFFGLMRTKARTSKMGLAVGPALCPVASFGMCNFVKCDNSVLGDALLGKLSRRVSWYDEILYIESSTTDELVNRGNTHKVMGISGYCKDIHDSHWSSEV
ncbi:hypothetical protein VNO77_08548 [Canavalia gladiata]|uniref:Uncharacterized protein n=1 Tax=Canavalia gladiata TaxID=3824 RepID=A0AAN9QTU3_CANGL